MKRNRLHLLACLALGSSVFAESPIAPKKPSVWDAAHWAYIHIDPPGKAAIKGVTHHVLYSTKMQRDVGFNILLPDDYQTSGKRYPVVYALHGATGHEGSRWASPLVADMMRKGEVPPAIWVWPAGGQGSMWRDRAEGNPHRVYVETFFIKELIPHIDATWRTLAVREGRAVMGFSMGGYGGAYLGFKHPDLFCAIAPMAGGAFAVKPGDEGKPGMNELAPVVLLQQNLGRIKTRMGIFIVVSAEDMNYQPTLKLTTVLDELGVPYEKSFPPGIEHNLNQYWATCGRPLTTWLHAQLAPAK